MMKKKIYKAPIIEIFAEEEIMISGTSGEIKQGGTTGGGSHGTSSNGKSTFTFVGSFNDED